MPSLNETLTVQQLKDQIITQRDAVPEHGITQEHGDWVSQEDEQARLNRLFNDIVYFMREYV